MTTDVDICNRALGEIGARTLIASLAEATPAGRACALNYDTMRRQILRAAPWGFARKTLQLTRLGLLTDTPPASPYPWLAKFVYPADCLKVRYVLPTPAATSTPGVPNVSDMGFGQSAMPSRNNRYLPAFDDSVVPSKKVLLSNLSDVTCIYTADVVDPDLWDDLFANALVMGLANKLVMPLSGNVKLKSSYAQMAEQSILTARAVDGNEAVPSTDHTPDWITARGITGHANASFAGSGFNLGSWFGADDNIAWGM